MITRQNIYKHNLTKRTLHDLTLVDIPYITRNNKEMSFRDWILSIRHPSKNEPMFLGVEKASHSRLHLIFLRNESTYAHKIISSLKQKSLDIFYREDLEIIYQNSGAGRSSGYREPSPQEIAYQAELHRKFPQIITGSQTPPVQNNYSRPVAMVFNNDMSSIDSTINPNFNQNDTKTYLSASTTNDGPKSNGINDFQKSIDSIQSSITSLHLKMEAQQKQIKHLEKTEQKENTSIKRKLENGEINNVEAKIRTGFENRFQNVENLLEKLMHSNNVQANIRSNMETKIERRITAEALIRDQKFDKQNKTIEQLIQIINSKLVPANDGNVLI